MSGTINAVFVQQGPIPNTLDIRTVLKQTQPHFKTGPERYCRIEIPSLKNNSPRFTREVEFLKCLYRLNIMLFPYFNEFPFTWRKNSFRTYLEIIYSFLTHTALKQSSNIFDVSNFSSIQLVRHVSNMLSVNVDFQTLSTVIELSF